MREIIDSYICQECGRRVPTDRLCEFIFNCPSCVFISLKVGRINNELDKSCPVCFSPVIFYNNNDTETFSVSSENLFCSDLDCSGYTIKRNSRLSYDIYYRGNLSFLFQPAFSIVYRYQGGVLCTVQSNYMQSFIHSLGEHLVRKYKRQLSPIIELDL